MATIYRCDRCGREVKGALSLHEVGTKTVTASPSAVGTLAEICGAYKDALKAWLAPIPRQARNA